DRHVARRYAGQTFAGPAELRCPRTTDREPRTTRRATSENVQGILSGCGAARSAGLEPRHRRRRSFTEPLERLGHVVDVLGAGTSRRPDTVDAVLDLIAVARSGFRFLTH